MNGSLANARIGLVVVLATAALFFKFLGFDWPKHRSQYGRVVIVREG